MRNEPKKSFKEPMDAYTHTKISQSSKAALTMNQDVLSECLVFLKEQILSHQLMLKRQHQVRGILDIASVNLESDCISSIRLYLSKASQMLGQTSALNESLLNALVVCVDVLENDLKNPG